MGKFDSLESLLKKVARGHQMDAARAALSPLPDLGDLDPGIRRTSADPDPSQEWTPAGEGLVRLPDLGDLEPHPREPSPLPRDAPSLASRMRLDLGDLEPRPAREEVLRAPERHVDLSEISDGGWVVIDRGEWEFPNVNVPFGRRKTITPQKRKNRYGVIPVADLPEDQPVSGTIMSQEKALDVARQLNDLRDVMES